MKSLPKQNPNCSTKLRGLGTYLVSWERMCICAYILSIEWVAYHRYTPTSIPSLFRKAMLSDFLTSSISDAFLLGTSPVNSSYWSWVYKIYLRRLQRPRNYIPPYCSIKSYPQNLLWRRLLQINPHIFMQYLLRPTLVTYPNLATAKENRQQAG